MWIPGKTSLLIAVLVALSGCETWVGPYGSPIEPYGRPIEPYGRPVGGLGGPAPGGALDGTFSLITPQQEIELGEQVASEVEKQQLLLNEPNVQSYVQAVGHRIAANASRQDVPYSFKVIDEPDVVNAFALPGGRMYIYTGMMRLAENEAELAAVIAHEIAHVVLRHHAAMITRQYGFDLLTGIILGENPDARSELVADLVGAGVEARYSRDQERAADELGMQLLADAGYDPAAMITVFQKMLAESERRPNLPIFASHPPTEERMQRLQALAQTFPASVRTNPVYAERYQEVLSQI